MFDIHSHILPGVDDGSRCLSESIEMLQNAKKAGFDRIVCTPHCRWDGFNVRLILAAYETLLPHAASLGIRLDLGYEVYWRKLAELGLETAPSLAISGTNMFLLEFSTEGLPTQWPLLLRNLQQMDLQLIIAHPERYLAVQQDLAIAREMRNMGCLLQVSANFATSGVFDPRRRTAIELLREGLVDYVASDAHRPSDYSSYGRALAFAQKFAR